MAILYDEVRRIFHLQTPGTSYVIGLVKDGAAPVHLYWGRKIRPGAEERLLRRGWRHAPAPFPGDNTLSYDWLPLEYPGYGTGDFRHPAYEAQLDDGTTAVELIYTTAIAFSAASRRSRGCRPSTSNRTTRRRRWSLCS